MHFDVLPYGSPRYVVQMPVLKVNEPVRFSMCLLFMHSYLSVLKTYPCESGQKASNSQIHQIKIFQFNIQKF